MSIISIGEYIEGINFKVLEERRVRASSGVMFLIGVYASINGFIFHNYSVIPYISGFLVLSFFVSVFINPKYSPTMLIGGIFVGGQSPLYIGAIQKKFAWSLGLVLSTIIFLLSLFLLRDNTYFDSVCLLCIACLILLYLETAFGICVGCKIYYLTIKTGLLPKPKEKPNCMGDACDVQEVARRRVSSSKTS